MHSRQHIGQGKRAVRGMCGEGNDDKDEQQVKKWGLGGGAWDWDR